MGAAAAILARTAVPHSLRACAGPKAVCQHHALAELTQEQAQKEKVSCSGNTPPPWERQWANFVKAQRHLLNLAMLESQSDAELSPMHIVQRDETIASIARVRMAIPMQV